MKRVKENLSLLPYAIIAAIVFNFIASQCTAQLLTYEMTQDLPYAVKTKNGSEYQVYSLKDGRTIKKGDLVSIGKPLKGKIFRTIAHEKLKASEIVYGTFDYASKLSNDEHMVVESIIVVHEKIDTASPLNVVLILKNKDKKRFKTVLSIEKAVSYDEIVI